jgi:hypothetical protein
MWIYPGLISYPHLTYWNWIFSRGRLWTWSISLSQSICFDYRFTWSVTTLLWLIHPDGDHLDDEIPSDARDIIVLGMRNNESFIFEKWRRSLLNVGDKCVDTYLASLDCKGIQNQSPRHECLKLSYRVNDKCNRGWTNNRKIKSRAWSLDIYGLYWNNVWWMRWFMWSCERPITHICWINTIPLCNISSKWHELKYVVNRILKIRHEILGGLVSLNYKYATYKSRTE